jgi:hypothetical protein
MPAPRARDIGVAANGATWIIGNTVTGPGGYSIHQLQNGKWTTIPGGAIRVDVGPDGVPWVVGKTGNIYKRQGTRWQRVPGTAKDIGIGPNGSVWIIGTDTQSEGYGIYYLAGGAWKQVAGGAVHITVGPRSTPWLVNSSGKVFKKTEVGSQSRLPTAPTVSRGLDQLPPPIIPDPESPALPQTEDQGGMP